MWQYSILSLFPLSLGLFVQQWLKLHTHIDTHSQTCRHPCCGRWQRQLLQIGSRKANMSLFPHLNTAFSHAVSFSVGETHKNLHSLQQNALVQRVSVCLRPSCGYCCCFKWARSTGRMSCAASSSSISNWPSAFFSFIICLQASLIGRTCQSVTRVWRSICFNCSFN